MDFELNDEQTMLRDSVMRFGQERYDPARRLDQLRAGAASDRSIWREMAELGWLALPVAEAQGGLGGTAVDVMALAEGFGRHLMLEPFATSAVIAPVILAQADPDVAASLCEGLIDGALMFAPAFAEQDARFDLHHVALTASRVEGGYRLSGDKCHAENGADADWFIVSARLEGAVDDRHGIALFLVPRDAPGLTISGVRAMDHHRHARLSFADVAVNARHMVGTPETGLALLERAVDHGIAALLAEAVGSMEALRDQTLDYLKTRKQFGVAIASFQALQHRMVDIAIACEEARSMTYHATLHLDAAPATRRRAVSAAKARVGQCALYVGRQSVQLHGGVGTSDELIVSHHLKRLMMIDLAFGNAAHHRGVFAES